MLSGLQIDVRAHDRDAAVASGFLHPATRHAGLSLGDRACLALAAALDLPVSKPSDEDDLAYAYVNASKVFHFSPVD